MKTAISIPDPIFHAAEHLAKRLGMSRSELFSRAVATYIEAHKSDRVRETLNQVYAKESSSLDLPLMEMQSASLLKEDW